MFPFVKKFDVPCESEVSLSCNKPSNKMSYYRLVACWYQEVLNISLMYFGMFQDIVFDEVWCTKNCELRCSWYMEESSRDMFNN